MSDNGNYNNMIKLLLEQINKNVEVLRNSTDNKISNIELNIDKIREQIILLSNKIDTIKSECISKADCKENRNEIKDNNNNEIKKEEISLQKIVLITGCISAGISSIIGLITGFLNNAT